MRAVFSVVGVEDVLAKCRGSRNPLNVVRATIQGLSQMANPHWVAKKRGKSIKALLHVSDTEVELSTVNNENTGVEEDAK